MNLFVYSILWLHVLIGHVQPTASFTKNIHSFWAKKVYGTQADCTNHAYFQRMRETIIENDPSISDCTMCEGFVEPPGTTTQTPLETRRSEANPSERALEECVVTEEIVLQVLELLRKAWETISRPPPRKILPLLIEEEVCSANHTCFGGEDTRNWLARVEDCQAFLEEMEKLIVDITYQIELIMQWLDDPCMVLPLIEQLKGCVRCLDQRIDELIGKYEEESGCLQDYISQLRQCYLDALMQKTETILRLQETLVQKNFELVGSHIAAGKYLEAVLLYGTLNNASMLSPLTKKLYLDKVDVGNILSFAMSLANINDKLRIYSELYTLAEGDGELSFTSHVITFQRAVRVDVENFCPSPVPPLCSNLPIEFERLITNIDFYANMRINVWAFQIREANFDSIIKFGSTHIKNLAGNTLLYNMDHLVKRMYDVNYFPLPPNLDNVLAFLTALGWDSHRLQGFTTLLGQLTDPNHKLKMSFKLKYIMEHMAEADPEGDMADKFRRLKETIPKHIRCVVWHALCTLVNTRTNGYLYVQSFSIDKVNSYLSVTPLNPTNKDWRFESVEKDGGYEFKFRVGTSNYYLGSEIPWSTENYVTAVLENEPVWPSSYINWRIEFEDSPDNVIKLLYLGRNSYMYGSGFLYLPGGVHQEAFWKIECTEPKTVTNTTPMSNSSRVETCSNVNNVLCH